MKEKIRSAYNKSQMLIRYVIAGGVGAVVQLAMFYFLNEILGLWYLYAVPFAFFAALVAAFSLQKSWTFRSYSRDSSKRQFFFYTIIAIGNVICNAAIMYIMVETSRLNPTLSQALAIIILTPVSFLFNKKITFVS